MLEDGHWIRRGDARQPHRADRCARLVVGLLDRTRMIYMEKHEISLASALWEESHSTRFR